MCVFPWHTNGLLDVSSVGKVKGLWSNLLKYGKSAPCIENLVKKGTSISEKEGHVGNPM